MGIGREYSHIRFGIGAEYMCRACKRYVQRRTSEVDSFVDRIVRKCAQVMHSLQQIGNRSLRRRFVQ